MAVGICDVIFHVRGSGLTPAFSFSPFAHSLFSLPCLAIFPFHCLTLHPAAQVAIVLFAKKNVWYVWSYTYTVIPHVSFIDFTIKIKYTKFKC